MQKANHAHVGMHAYTQTHTGIHTDTHTVNYHVIKPIKHHYIFKVVMVYFTIFSIYVKIKIKGNTAE